MLDPNTSVFGDATMFLDCDTTLFTDAFRDDMQAADANVWTASDLYKDLNTNDDAFLKTSFTSAEETAIANSTRAAHPLVLGSGSGNVGETTQLYFVNYTPLTGEKIFLLDAEDVSNIAYGHSIEDYDGTENRKKIKFTNPYSDNSYWWLRSPSKFGSGYAGIVYSDDSIYDSDVGSDKVGVSPAFNVSLSSVLLASQVNDATDTYGKEYKLTLKDSNTAITAGDMSRYSNTVTVPYTVTDSNADDGITADTVSVLITDSNGAFKHYAPLIGDYSAKGSGTFDLPADYSETDKVYILAEDTHEGDTDKYLTDYASDMVAITVPVAVTAKGHDYDCVSRVFAPKYGMNEDPVTGSMHCMIAPYWSRRLNKPEITAFQASSRTGILYCECIGDKVIISGKAVLFSINDIVDL